MRAIGVAGRIVALMAFVSASLCSGALAKDLEMLTRLLIPAYMAQNFTTVCVAKDAQFLSDLPDRTASVGAFAEHVEKEVTINLPESEAGRVRVTAADAARQVARQELQLLSGQETVVPAGALKQWCDRSAKHFIIEIMNKHQEKHEEFEKLAEVAKH